MIRMEDITFTYARRPIFEGFSWQVARGEVWAVLGPSGCGKSTLLLLLAGLVAPQTGKIEIQGEMLDRPRPQTSLVLQEYGLLPWATLRENVALGLRIRRFYGPDGRHAPQDLRLDANDIAMRTENWLRRLDIYGLADYRPSQVSGGQRQRAAIARALVLQPDLLLMDEPFAALDAPTREDLQALTLALCSEAGLTVVLVTHTLEEAAFVGQRILILDAPPNHVPHSLANPHTADAAYRRSAAYYAQVTKLRGRLEGA